MSKNFGKTLNIPNPVFVFFTWMFEEKMSFQLLDAFSRKTAHRTIGLSIIVDSRFSIFFDVRNSVFFDVQFFIFFWHSVLKISRHSVHFFATHSETKIVNFLSSKVKTKNIFVLFKRFYFFVYGFTPFLEKHKFCFRN